MKYALHSVVSGLFLVSTAAIADDLPTFRLLMKDGRFFPETIEVPAQTRFRLEVKNEGPGATEFESLELKKELVLAPGVTRTSSSWNNCHASVSSECAGSVSSSGLTVRPIMRACSHSG